MKTYGVLVGFDANQPLTIKADSPREAAEKGRKEASAGLCHQCADELQVNDQTYVLVYGENEGALYEESPERDNALNEARAAVEAIVVGKSTVRKAVRDEALAAIDRLIEKGGA